MVQKVMVPLDGSSLGEEALPAAFRLASRTGSHVHLVRVRREAEARSCGDVRAFPATSPPSLEQEYLENVAAGCEQEWGIRAHVRLLHGEIPASIVGYAVDAAMSWIVMTTHGCGGISKALVGRVAQAVAHRSAVPVMLIRPQQATRLATRREQNQIVVPLDGSAFSESALTPALALSTALNASVTLLGVVAPAAVWLPHLPSTFAETVAGTPRADADVYLECIAADLRAEGVHIDIDTVTNSAPAAGILDYISRHDVAAIVMAAHGRSGGTRVSVGSVADRLMRDAATPLVLFRPLSVEERDVAHRDVA